MPALTETELTVEWQTVEGGASARPRPGPFVPYVKAVGRGHKLRRDLTLDESIDAMRLMLRGQATPAQVGAFLIAQRVKGEAEAEIRGFVQAVRDDFMRRIHPRVDGLLDLGVPYDGKARTAQLAPAVAVVLASAGVPTLLHGDSGVPTKQGIAPGAVFEALGVPVDLEPEAVERLLEAVGVGYLAAPRFVPAWHALTPLRREFGLRTALNTVEKLFNPADAPYQVSGFFHGEYLERLRSAQTGTRASWMVQGEEGSIEMAAGRPTRIFAVDPTDDQVLDPAVVGLERRERIQVPQDTSLHARLNAEAIAGVPGPATEQVALTAGAVLALVGAAADLTDGVARARQALQSGAAQARLELARTFGGNAEKR